MKIEFTAEERKYLYNLLKLVAVGSKDTPQTAGFWLGLANRLGPNQSVVHMRRSQAEYLLTAVEAAVKRIGMSHKEGAELNPRADVLKLILGRAQQKLAAKIAQGKDDEENGTT